MRIPILAVLCRRSLPALTGLLFTLLAGLCLAPAALAQVVSTVKTPPLAESQSILIPINVHIPAKSPSWAGWAGAIVKTHIIDATELDVVSLQAGPGFFGNVLGTPNNYIKDNPLPNPFGPPSSNAASTPHSVNYFLPGLSTVPGKSGISVVTSSTFNVANQTIHVKNSTFQNNSDIDITLMLWNIYHLRSDANLASLTLTLQPSDRLWVKSAFNDPEQLHNTDSTYGLPSGAIQLDSASPHWLHFTQTAMFHLNGFGSQYFATLASTVHIGIEHVPEPSTGMLFAGAFLALALSRYTRHRRLRG